ncbi:MAG: glycosyltransferase family 2 protein [Nitrososphaerota archaeon]|nr:glycosyltransferase family 2 protein [Nitrososphaerota archaeon]MDG6932293.1 glycosyltransferase family 2 protein [Nitrososphaerota archaeon]MDG6936469.1 glycosyltransferase family 2 protein [Nitrososphaerota archaeon]MDG6944665.1 glycosyltransferase family 2 protein [Nitrososphaerota archaeon]
MEYLSIFYMAIETLLTVFGLYWGIIIVAGFLHNTGNKNAGLAGNTEIPFSVIIPAKNEEKTLGRLLERLTRVNYPKDKLEIIVVEDGSTDSTPEIAGWYSREFSNVKYYHLEKNRGGKAAALNYGVNASHGSIIAFFDADALPELDYFRKAVKGYLEGKEVQNGFYRFINTRESWLPTISSLEAEVAKYIARGSERLGLPVPIFGYNLIISRRALDEVGSFKKSLTEDIDLWVRLVKAKIKPHYFDGEVLIESPSSVKDFVNQRIRWYRGFLDTITLYKLNFSSKNELHVWLYLTMPLFAAISFTMYLVAPTAIMLSHHLYGLLMLGGVTSNIVGMSLGAAIYLYYVYRDKSVSFKGPLSVVYTFALLYSSFLALVSKIFKTNISWNVTKKTGYMDVKKL